MCDGKKEEEEKRETGRLTDALLPERKPHHTTPHTHHLTGGCGSHFRNEHKFRIGMDWMGVEFGAAGCGVNTVSLHALHNF